MSTTDGAWAIRTTTLVKRFGAVTAVDRVDLQVATGARLGLLGPNGSGKTTLVRLLLGLVHATSGQIEVLGERVPQRSARVLPRVGALVEGPGAYEHLSGRANLRLMDAAGPGGSRRDRSRRVEQSLSTVGLAGVGRRRVKGYSLGMRQRLGLAAALLRDPELLLLDEPTNGLDPQGIHELRALLLAVNAAGTTVVLSSHLLTEVEAFCTDVAVLDRGRLAFHGSLAELRKPTGRVVVRTPDTAAARALLGAAVVDSYGDQLLVAADDTAALNARLVTAGLRVQSLQAERRSLEDMVLHLTGPSSDRYDLAGGEQDAS
ncbi:MAG TPA: ATP-binding cassette domain-containing protein [Mycobacteriales bacterium]|nr:ATP-binding cassette domain-containing protein [Mycobacteriales bacterium]